MFSPGRWKFSPGTVRMGLRNGRFIVLHKINSVAVILLINQINRLIHIGVAEYIKAIVYI